MGWAHRNPAINRGAIFISLSGCHGLGRESWNDSLTIIGRPAESLRDGSPDSIEYAGAAYHVMARGNQGRPIYADDLDRQIWLATVGEACEV